MKVLFKQRLLLLIVVFVGACTVQDHNPQENQVDSLWLNENYQNALEIIEPAAQRGLPWAMLRLGIAYEYGQGKAQNYSEALYWYKQLAGIEEPNAWSDGVRLGLAGNPGYFAQNQDARMAQYLVGRIYANGGYGEEQDLQKAWLWLNYLVQQGNKDLIYCCEQSRRTKQVVEFERVEALYVSVNENLASTISAAEKHQLQLQALRWKP